jgi:SdpC family antimicrobial peptide
VGRQAARRRARAAQSNPQDVAAKLDHQADLAKDNGWSASSVARMHDAAAQIRAGHFDLSAGADQTAMRSMVSAKIRDLDPGFFDRFGAGMQSGDPVQVDKSLSDGVHMLQAALDDMGGQNENSPDNLPIPAPVAWRLIYVALSVAVVVATVSIAIGVLVFGLEKDDTSGRLAHQELVARLANGLAN